MSEAIKDIIHHAAVITAGTVSGYWLRRLLGLRDRLDLTCNFGLNASAFVDIDMRNSRVFRHIDIR